MSSPYGITPFGVSKVEETKFISEFSFVLNQTEGRIELTFRSRLIAKRCLFVCIILTTCEK